MNSAGRERMVGEVEGRHENWENEVSLVDLTLILWRNRRIGIWVGSVPLVIALMYALSAAPVYQAITFIQPPLVQGVEALNTRTPGAITYSVEDVYLEVIKKLNSKELRRQFFQQQNLFKYYGNSSSLEDTFRSKFDQALTVDLSKRNSSDFVRVNFESGDPKRAAELLNLYVEYVQVSTVAELISNANSNSQGRIELLRDQMEGKRTMFKSRLQDSIQAYEEALIIARKLSMRNPVNFAAMLHDKPQDESILDASQVIQMPLYFRGSAALEVELEVLKLRKADDRFIEGLRSIQEELALLESRKIRPEMIHVLRIDQPALVPDAPVQPNRKLIILVGIIMGGLAGLFAASFAHFLGKFWRELRQKIA